MRPNDDGLVKSLNLSFSVIPAKAGIQYFQILLDACLRRACPCVGRGMTEFRTFYETINDDILGIKTWSSEPSQWQLAMPMAIIV